MNGYLFTKAIIALQGSGQVGVREAGSRGCALPRYTQKVWDFHPHRLMKDRSTSPTYGTRVDLHILHKVLRPPLLEVASYERLPQGIDYPISQCISRCCVYFTDITVVSDVAAYRMGLLSVLLIRCDAMDEYIESKHSLLKVYCVEGENARITKLWDTLFYC
jgi:hypothetical protein